MISDSLRAAEREFRRAVERRQYSDLELCAAELRAAVNERLAALPKADPARNEMASRVFALMEWARTMISIQRQRWAKERHVLPLISRYLERPKRRPAGVCIDL